MDRSTSANQRHCSEHIWSITNLCIMIIFSEYSHFLRMTSLDCTFVNNSVGSTSQSLTSKPGNDSEAAQYEYTDQAEWTYSVVSKILAIMYTWTILTF